MTIIINGIGFNVQACVRKTLEQFVSENIKSGAYNKYPNREELLTRAYNLIREYESVQIKSRPTTVSHLG